MPINKSAYFRFEVLDECLRNNKRKWSKSDLLNYVNRRLELHYGPGTSISLSQLRYDLESIQSECGAPIQVYREGRSCFYCYEDLNFSLKNIPIQEEDIQVLRTAASLLQQITGFSIADEMASIISRLERKYNFNCGDEAKAIITVEHMNNIPKPDHLEDIYHAIIRRNVLKITFSSQRTLNITPYQLKETDGAWLLSGYCEEDAAICEYALDDMETIKVSKLRYHFLERQPL